MGRFRVRAAFTSLLLAVAVAGCPALFEDVVVGSLPGLDAGVEVDAGTDAGFVGGWGAGSFRVFASDAPRDDWTAVEFTLARVDVVTEAGEVVTVADGLSQAFDVRALATDDGSVRRRYLASGPVPPVPCRAVRFAFVGGVGARPAGASGLLPLAFGPSVTRDGPLSVVEVPLDPIRRLDSEDDLSTVDFDLDRFTFDTDAATVTPSLVDRGSRPRTDLGAQEPIELDGRVRTYSDAGGTPVASLDVAGATWDVRFGALVPVTYLPPAAEGPAPAPGDRALVTGTFDPVSGALVAASFVLVTGTDVVTEGDVPFPVAAPDTFDLLPVTGASTTFHVLLQPTTQYRDAGGVPLDRTGFLNLPAATRRIRVNGVPLPGDKLHAWQVTITTP